MRAEAWPRPNEPPGQEHLREPDSPHCESLKHPHFLEEAGLKPDQYDVTETLASVTSERRRCGSARRTVLI